MGRKIADLDILNGRVTSVNGTPQNTGSSYGVGAQLVAGLSLTTTVTVIAATGAGVFNYMHVQGFAPGGTLVRVLVDDESLWSATLSLSSGNNPTYADFNGVHGGNIGSNPPVVGADITWRDSLKILISNTTNPHTSTCVCSLAYRLVNP